MQTATIDHTTARKAMIDSQLRTSGVNEPFVLERMGAVAREDFVPDAARAVAYIDRAIPLDNGRRLAAPLFYGMMLAEAKPDLADRVLVVDSGAGYLPELLRPLVGTVDVIGPEEAVAPLHRHCNFTLLLIDGAAEAIPASLAAQLAEGGRIVTGTVANGVTRLAIGRRAGADVALLPLAEIGIPRLGEFDKPRGWSF
ncbi:protein-L-isoaspartate O-methyltransferase [Altererythrobacter sp. H2]|uniref:protein-L-isoaspartate O-methyltransferase family protein n=1 Tax=Altererythrobacter sp. H2 TaxID=3108391 RepID=UPI002B4C02A2|nr:protein-L-isoaspartate O-methyltransferase [Altererythrobacter sp. H2]WRK96073.1 protein-L-isoaspartate O-methyltransferase [Altererythrobacter sp. H2]